MSEPFNIERGVLQGDIFSPVSFIAGLDRIFRRHDISNTGVTVGAGENAVCVSKLEYADDAALIDENVEQASARVTAIAKGSLEEAAMVISTTTCSEMSTRSSIWEADSRVMAGMTKLTCVIAWTLRKRHSRHCPTYGPIIAFHAVLSLGFIICAYVPH